MFVRQSIADIIGVFPQETYRLEFEKMISIMTARKVYADIAHIRENVVCGDLNDIEIALLHDCMADLYWKEDNSNNKEVLQKFAEILDQVKPLPPKVTMSWTTTLETIPDSEDFFLPIPDELGWKEGDEYTLTLIEGDSPYLILRKHNV